MTAMASFSLYSNELIENTFFLELLCCKKIGRIKPEDLCHFVSLCWTRLYQK